MLQRLQNLGWRFGASRMHLSPSVAWAAVPSRAMVLLLLTCCPIVGVCNCSMSCCTLLYVHSSFCNHLGGEVRDGCFA